MSQTTEAQVARLKGPRQLVFETERLDAAALKPDEVLAATLCSAISVGTELAAWLGEPPLRPGPIYPRVTGYCNVAKVLACGAEVKLCQPGDRILSFQSHRSAFICPESKIILKLPETADQELAVTTYLFHLGYNALLKGGLTPGHEIAVVGLGTLGLGVVALASCFGARVSAFSNQADARERALALGAACAMPKTEVRPFADLVVSTSNLWDDWLHCLRLARQEGAIAVIGFPGRGQPTPEFNPLDSQFFYEKQLRLIACGRSPNLNVAPHELRFTVKRNCEFLLHLILSGRLPAQKLIGGHGPWQELPEIYARLASGTQARLTHILRWQ